MTVAQSTSLNIEKDATVPAARRMSTGDTINYTLAVTNTGNAAIADVVVDDPLHDQRGAGVPAPSMSATPTSDNLLDVGETWDYTAATR